MDKRPLGRSGLATAPLCLGGNVFGWTADEKTSFEILDRFVPWALEYDKELAAVVSGAFTFSVGTPSKTSARL